MTRQQLQLEIRRMTNRMGEAKRNFVPEQVERLRMLRFTLILPRRRIPRSIRRRRIDRQSAQRVCHLALRPFTGRLRPVVLAHVATCRPYSILAPG